MKAACGAKALASVTLLLMLTACSWQDLHPVFGGQPDADSQARIQASTQFDGEYFSNAEPTRIFTPKKDGTSPLRQWLGKWWQAPADKNPQHPLPSQPLEPGQPLPDDSLIWLGHAGALLKTGGLILLTDPVFHRASPIPFPWLPLPLVAEPFPLQHPLSPEHLPDRIDAILISHDHFDHLDRQSILQLDARVGHYYVPLGVKAHLQRWGVPGRKITEMDWHERVRLSIPDDQNISAAQSGSRESASDQNARHDRRPASRHPSDSTQTDKAVEVIMTPARHFSGRMSSGHFSTLWASWVVKSPTLSVFINGDSGYGKHYAEIGQRYGPFDIALVESGGYDEDWAEIHLFPEETVQATQDLRAALLLPTHWARFDLAHHRWQEPIERLLAAAKPQKLRVTTPLIGEVFTLDAPPERAWWR
ncbi:MAG: MBL fold metallo-hydrolase [Lautropia sp.]|nr:MBL fold metallo-hydrolase [Lautropia sp.]